MRQHNEPGGGQNVWHFHVHVLPRRADDRLNELNAAARTATVEERASLAAQLRLTLAPSPSAADGPRFGSPRTLIGRLRSRSE
jgi:hypothetical protein